MTELNERLQVFREKYCGAYKGEDVPLMFLVDMVQALGLELRHAVDSRPARPEKSENLK